MDVIVLSNRYELLELVGSGGMASVYRALDTTLNRMVAVKILKEDFLDDSEFVDKFHQEALSVAKFSHPNIVAVYDVAVDNEYHYIVMEYIKGATLSDYIKSKGKLEEMEALGIGIQIAKALDHAHKNGVVHRDIKPHNVLLAEDGTLKVADFGIAKATSSKTMTIGEKTMGSVHYFSPEQARGGFVDVRSDLYSLGCVMFEMLIGEAPYQGETPIVIAVKHLQDPVPECITRIPEINEDINNLVKKTMAKSIDERYQSAKDLLVDMNAIANGNEIIEKFDITLDFIEKVDKEKKEALDQTKDFVPVYEDDSIETVKKEVVIEPYIREEYDLSLAKRKTHKKHTFVKFIAVLSAFILIAVLSFYGLKEMLAVVVPETITYEVEDYTNMDYDQVSQKLYNDFKIETIKNEEYSDEIAKGVIISQDMAVGIEFKEAASVNRINFVVSAGPDIILIADLALFDYRVAERDLIDLGLLPVQEQVYDVSIEKGKIIRTDPQAGLEVKPGSTIKVYVSKGPELDEIEVPNLLGKTMSEVEALLDFNNLVLGDVTPKDILGENAVVTSQYPEAGDIVYEDSKVHIQFYEAKRLIVPYALNPINLDEMEEEITVYVEMIPSDTMLLEETFTITIDKDAFPYEIEIPVPIYGKTSVKVFYNFTDNEEFELLYSDYKYLGYEEIAAPDNAYLDMEGYRLLVPYEVVPANLDAFASEEVVVYIQATPTDSNVIEDIITITINKTQFPLVVKIPLPVNGTTDIKIYYNYETLVENQILYDTYKDDWSIERVIYTPESE